VIDIGLLIAPLVSHAGRRTWRWSSMVLRM
jgi:hypothetical protein